jgi:hypothetical protein
MRYARNYGVEATPIVRCSLRELIVFSDVA